MMTDLMQIGIRSIVAMVALLACTKIMGRRELAEMSMFDYILGISIGAIGAELAINIEESWYDYLVALVVFIGIHQMITWATIKNMWARKFFEGAPIIIMEDGKIIEKNLKRVHYDINTFLEECRLEGYFDISDINTAIMESTGTLSFIRKVKDPSKQIEIVANLIIDGQVIRSNLSEIEKSEQWLEEEVAKEGRKIEEVLLATYSKKKGLILHFKNEKTEVTHVLE